MADVNNTAILGTAILGEAKLGAPINTRIENMLNAPVRQIQARAELYSGSTLAQTFGYADALKEFTVTRAGDESKFFGYGVCNKLNVKLIDTARQLHITTANSFKVAFGVEDSYIYTLPAFDVTEVHRDELTNELSITAYDALYRANNHTVAELALPEGDLTISDYAAFAAIFLGLSANVVWTYLPAVDKYAQRANLEGTESVRELLNAIAEATQTIYFINKSGELVFKRLDIDGPPVHTIDKEHYYTLESKDNRRLTAVCSANELGDNVIATMGQTGTTQYVRDNPFWELREDIDELVENALANVGGLTINQFECSWRGNFLLEIGDKIAFITKDNTATTTYLLDDTITYNGYFAEQTQWNYTSNDGETAGNPSTLGEALKQTYARVDKANKKIELLVSERNDEREQFTQIQQTTNDVNIAVKEIAANGVDKVVTGTGYKFDAEGLTVSKDGSEMSTQITDDGMTVSRDNTEMLKADHDGVKAANLHATTYLIIGENSRLEDYKSNRTACFWIGG
jgi:hypothetical protein